MLRNLLVLLSFLALTGCGSSVKNVTPFQKSMIKAPSAGEVTVVFYKPKRLIYSDPTADVVVNGNIVGKLPDEGFLEKTLPAGRYTIYPDMHTSGVINKRYENTFEDGKTYYLKLKASGFGIIGFDFIDTDEEAALEELSKLKRYE